MPSTKSSLIEKLFLVALGVGTLGLAGVVGTQHLEGLRQRLDTLESRVADAPRRNRAIADDVARVRAELESIREELDRAQTQAETAHELADRLNGTERMLDDIAGTIEAHDTSLSALERYSSNFGPETLEARFAERDEAITTRWESLSRMVDSATRSAIESRERLDELHASLAAERDVLGMWNDLVGPTVMLAGENSVGSGVLLASRPRATDDDVFDTYILTAWHVVRDIIEGDFDLPVPVTIYRQDGTIDDESAELLEHDAAIDVAILRLDSDDPTPCGAALATRERLGNIHIFDRVYAVGCPLGNDPIPTPGEISTYNHNVDGISYWMINAPTYIGNSGGGIFDANTHELLGIFSKIYTHGALRPTIVPHMGLVTPLGVIYDWLEEVGYGELIPTARTAVAAAASNG